LCCATQVDSIEFSQIQARVFDSLKDGNAVLQELNKQMNVDDIEILMADTADAIAYQQQVTEALTGKLSTDELESIESDLMAFLASEGQDVTEAPSTTTTTTTTITTAAQEPAPASPTAVREEEVPDEIHAAFAAMPVVPSTPLPTTQEPATEDVKETRTAVLS
jgi:charged multivesicular body protein 6